MTVREWFRVMRREAWERGECQVIIETGKILEAPEVEVLDEVRYGDFGPERDFRGCWVVHYRSLTGPSKYHLLRNLVVSLLDDKNPESVLRRQRRTAGICD